MPSYKTEDFRRALMEVKAPGAKLNIIEAKNVETLDFSEKSVVVELKVPDLNPLIEKSLRYQIESAIKKLDPSLSVSVEFADISAQKNPRIGALIAVGSGKGGVGKSSVTVNLAVAFQKLGYKVGIFDCDVYGPSIPTMMGVEGQKPMMMNGKIQPIEAHGIKMISAGFFVEAGQGLIWRGPMIHKLIHQFYYDVDWKDVDVLLVDLPPGTGDAPLSLSQTMPLTGAVMVSMPQKVSLIDVHKGIAMFNQVKVPILGIIENMSHYECSSCHHREEIFDHGRVRKFCEELGIAFLGDIPIDPQIRARSDEGSPFMIEFSESKAGKAISQIASRLQPFLKTADELDGDALKIVV